MSSHFLYFEKLLLHEAGVWEKLFLPVGTIAHETAREMVMKHYVNRSKYESLLHTPKRILQNRSKYDSVLQTSKKILQNYKSSCISFGTG